MTDGITQSQVNQTAWAACVTFRGVVDAGQYKDYIFTTTGIPVAVLVFDRSREAEGEASLKVFLAMCREDGVEPGKQYSGKFNVRISPELHATIAAAAAADGKSLNQWITDELRHAVAD